MNQPLVSILISTNNPNWLDATISSIYSQTHKNFEVIISDSTPNNETRNVLTKWFDCTNPPQYFKNNFDNENESIKFLIAKAKGSFIKIIQDDGILLPNSLKLLLDILENNPNCALAFHQRYVIDSVGNITEEPTILSGVGSLELTPETFFDLFIARSLENIIGEPTNVLFRASTLKELKNLFAPIPSLPITHWYLNIYLQLVVSGFQIIANSTFASCTRQSRINIQQNEYLLDKDILRRYAAHNNFISKSQFLFLESEYAKLYHKYRSIEIEPNSLQTNRIENSLHKNYLSNDYLKFVEFVRNYFSDKQRFRLKKLLFLDWQVPKPNQDAGSVTAFFYLSIFQRLGFEVTFIPFSLDYHKGYVEALTNNNIEVLTRHDINSLDDWLKKNLHRYSLIFAARAPYVAKYMQTLKKSQIPIILNTVDLHFLRLKRQMELTGKIDETLLTEIRDTEISVINNSTVSIVISEAELYEVRAYLPSAKLRVIPLIFEDIPGSQKPFHERKDILFIGGFGHTPNIDAVLHFITNIFPLILTKNPDIKFHIIGSRVPVEIQKLHDNHNIIVHGFIDDIRPIFSNIKLSIAPLRFGAGIKGKIGTSFCYGVPCIATTIAAEGMGLEHNKNILIADSPADFANSVLEAYTNQDLWEKLSKFSHEFVKSNYSSEVIEKNVANMINNITENIEELHGTYKIKTYNDYVKHSIVMQDEYKRRLKFEENLCIKANGSPFKINGFCCICKKSTLFHVDFKFSSLISENNVPLPNWRERLVCEHCQMNNRMRAAIHLFCSQLNLTKTSSIYITEALTKTYKWVKTHYPNTIGSEYWGDNIVGGSQINKIRHENMMNLSFQDNSFECVLSFDVLEHIPDPDLAFKEVYRVLKNSGYFLWTAPFDITTEQDTIRAILQENGVIQHILPPEIHGNPTDPENGALCFRYFSWNALERLYDVGFKDVYCLGYWSAQQGHLGKELYMFVAQK